MSSGLAANAIFRCAGSTVADFREERQGKRGKYEKYRAYRGGAFENFVVLVYIKQGPLEKAAPAYHP
jgi:hypothetical protein